MQYLEILKTETNINREVSKLLIKWFKYKGKIQIGSHNTIYTSIMFSPITFIESNNCTPYSQNELKHYLDEVHHQETYIP